MFHNIIWTRSLKNVSVSKMRLELAVVDSVIVLTNGEMGRLESIQAVRPKYRLPSIKVR